MHLRKNLKIPGLCTRRSGGGLEENCEQKVDDDDKRLIRHPHPSLGIGDGHPYPFPGIRGMMMITARGIPPPLLPGMEDGYPHPSPGVKTDAYCHPYLGLGMGTPSSTHTPSPGLAGII